MDQVDSKPRVAAVDSNSNPKTLARKLEFTSNFVPTNVLMPEHPQTQLQMKIQAQVKPKPQPQTEPQPQAQPQQQPQPQPCPPTQPMVQVQAQPVRSIPRPEVQLRSRPHPVPIVQRVPHPVPILHPALPHVHYESPRARLTIKTEVKDGTPKKQKQCNCKNSKCLKLYCECFTAGMYCDGCNCRDCHNNSEHESIRSEAVTAVLDRNPNAFRPKIANSPHKPQNGRVEAGESAIAAKHHKGCNCRKSGCLKKYCECFQGNIPCSENCRCVDCKNCEGSEERRALHHHHGDNLSSRMYVQQQAANAVAMEALDSRGYPISQAPRKRKNSEETTAHYHPIQQTTQFPQRGVAKEYTQDNDIKLSTVPSQVNVMALGSSKLTFSSLMADIDILQPQNIKKHCSNLVGEALRVHTEHIGMSQNEMETPHINSCTSASAEQSVINRTDNTSLSIGNDTSTSNQADGECTSVAESSRDEVGNERPMSPGTLALMCNENDTTFTPEKENGVQGHGELSTENSELHAKQEKAVLTKFRDFLNELIRLTSVKEAGYNNEMVEKQQMKSLPNGIVNPSQSTMRPQLRAVSTASATPNHSSSNGTMRPKSHFETASAIPNRSSSNGVMRLLLPPTTYSAPVANHVNGIPRPQILPGCTPATMPNHSSTENRPHVLPLPGRTTSVTDTSSPFLQRIRVPANIHGLGTQAQCRGGEMPSQQGSDK